MKDSRSFAASAWFKVMLMPVLLSPPVTGHHRAAVKRRQALT
jgi:hypothetical protein